MKMKRSWNLVIVLFAVVAVLAAACRPRPPDAEPEVYPPLEFSEACDFCLETAQSDDPYGRPLEDLAFVPNQIILIGLPADIDFVAGQALTSAEAVASLNLADAIPELRQYREAQSDNKPLIPEQLWRQLPDTELRLYQLSGDDTAAVTDAMTTIAKITETGEGLSGVVMADLNYVTGAPWTISGGSIDGSAARISGNDLFWQQWAFNKSEGINLIDSSGQRVPTGTGAGVSIVLFDTSPFSTRGVYRFTGWMEPELTVSASFPVPVPPTGPAAISDHGLFAAGLAHGVAPDSNIHLVRVLNDSGQGYLYNLVQASAAAMTKHMGTGAAPLGKTVFNYSLTVNAQAEKVAAADPQLLAAIESLAKTAGFPPAPDGSDYHSATLEIPFEIISRLGGEAVAAAGNDSDDNWLAGDPPLPAALPAAFPGVIGVEASSKQRTPSCYSNVVIDSQDARAPGGDGGLQPPDVASTAAQCLPQNATAACTDDAANCPYGLVSLLLKQHQGFGTWVGSSFAAPLVSGAVALKLETGAPVAFTPGDVIQAP